MIKVRVGRRFAAAPEAVFDAWLDPARAGKFLFATATGRMVRVEIDARVGGKFVIVERRGDQEAAHYGEWLEIDRPGRLVFVYGVELYTDAVDRVTVEIAPLDGGCELTLTHELDPAYAAYAERAKQGWTSILAGLAGLLDLERVGQAVEASGLGPEWKARLQEAVLPSVRLMPQVAADVPPGGSKLGGTPDLPPGVEWPRDGEQPLAFIAQINLAEIAALPISTGMPPTGLLSFFYDAINQPWGDAGEEGGWRVIYHPGPAESLSPLSPPADLPLEARFPARALRPELDATLPHPFSHLIEHEWGLLGEAYWRMYESVHGDQVYHRMGGHPQNANSGMDYGLERVLPGAQDWRLLLQIDSDEETGMMWGDVGRLYFWIQAEDLKARRFERTWLVLQCS